MAGTLRAMLRIHKVNMDVTSVCFNMDVIIQILFVQQEFVFISAYFPM